MNKISLPEIIVFFIILVTTSFGTWLFFEKPLDDAYISLRYAEHLIHGDGLVFNIGEHVEAYSSYLCEMLICIGMSLGFLGEQVEQAISVMFYFLIIVLLTLFSRGRFKYPLLYLCVPALFVFSLANNFWEGLALETMLFSFMLLSSIIFYLKYKDSRWQRIFVGVWCCLLSMTRPEAVVYYLAILVFELLCQIKVNKKVNLRFLFEYSIGLLIFLFYLFSRWQYYGYFMPNTYYQKVGYNFKVWSHGASDLNEFIQINCGGAIIFFLVIMHGLLFRRERSWWLFFLIFLISSCLAFLSGGNWTPFWRYALPCCPLLAVLTGDFMEGAFLFSRKLGLVWKTVLRLCVSFIFCFILFRSSYEILLDSKSTGFIEGNKAFHAVAKLYGLILNKTLSPHQSIALNTVPFFSYYYEGHVYDMLGLTDAKIAHRKVDMGNGVYAHEKGDGFYILSMRPTIIKFESLGLYEKPVTGYPQPYTLNWISDHEIAMLEDFRRLYEPYNIYIPAAGKYVSFYKLKNQRLNSLNPAEIDSLYKSTVGVFSGGAREQVTKWINLFVNNLDSTGPFVAYRNFTEIVTLQNAFKR